MIMNTSYTIFCCVLYDSDGDSTVVFQLDARNSKWVKEDNTIENPIWINDTVSVSLNLKKTTL